MDAFGRSGGVAGMTDRNRLELVEGEPRSFEITVSQVLAGVSTPLDVSAVALTLHIHEQDNDDTEAVDPIPVIPKVPNVVGRGLVVFTDDTVADLSPATVYVYRLRLPSNESLDVGDLAVLRAWR